MNDWYELGDPQIGSDLWMERLDFLAEHAWGLAADILQESLQREFSMSPAAARTMALVELEDVSEDEFAELREKIVEKPDPMVLAFERLHDTFIP